MCGHVLSVFLVCPISIRLEVRVVDACRRGREKGRGDESIQYVPVDVVGTWRERESSNISVNTFQQYA